MPAAPLWQALPALISSTALNASSQAVSGILLLVFITLAIALVARQLRIPYTLALVVVGLLLAILPLPQLTGLHLTLSPDLILFLFLPALLFEGAWNLDLAALRRDSLIIGLFAGPGLALALAVIAAIVHWGTGLPFATTLILAAIVSPTDPIAVIALLRQLGMPARLSAIIEGESLFNDGVGAAAFQLTLGAALLAQRMGGPLTGLSTFAIILKAFWLLGGGLAIGAAVGYIVSRLVRAVDDPLIETTITFSVAYGVFLLTEALGSSGLLAVVAAGLTLGSYGRRTGMSPHTREMVDIVWEFTGHIANSLLFLLLGVSLGQTSLLSAIGVTFWAVVGVLLGRAIMVYTFLPAYNWLISVRSARIASHTLLRARIPAVWRPLLLLSGLRGALSLALVLSLPPNLPHLVPLRAAVYGIILITLLGQGLGLRLILPHWPQPTDD